MDCFTNGILVHDREDGKMFFKTYENEHLMFQDAAKFYCFADYAGDEFDIIDILYHGVSVEYAGWQPGMVFEFVDCETKESVYRLCEPNWDH